MRWPGLVSRRRPLREEVRSSWTSRTPRARGSGSDPRASRRGHPGLPAPPGWGPLPARTPRSSRRPRAPACEDVAMDPTLRLRRTGTRQGVAGNGRGATVRFGPADVDGAFTPGELLAVALAACNLMSADFPIARRVGEHVELTGEVTAVKDAATNRYAEASV